MPPQSAPLVSTIIPAYNAERYLAKAIESVLSQTYPRVECIVVDDGSTDGSADVARAFGDRVRLVSQHNQGVSAARNAGARETRSSLLAFLDADDWWAPELLTRLSGVLLDTDADVALCAQQVVGEDGTPAGMNRLHPMPTIESLLTFRGSVPGLGSNLLIRRGALDALGEWDERLFVSQDWELLVRIVARAVSLVYVDEPLTYYRRHPGSLTTDVDLLQSDMIRAYDLIFERDDAVLAPLRRRAYGRLHRMLSGSFAEARRPWRATVHAMRGVWWNPRSLPEIVGPALRRLRRTA
jgi:glycosyltransferase involved in cell wall biosynthesis